MISWDGDGERERGIVSCLSLDFSNLFMPLSKAAYSSEEQELSIAHVKAVWFFECHFSLLVSNIPCCARALFEIPDSALSYRGVISETMTRRPSLAYMNVCGMQKQWEIKVVRCINEWASFSCQWNGMKSTTWKSHASHCNEFSNHQPHTHTRVHHMLKNHLCRSFYKRLAAILHSGRAAALLPLFFFFFPKSIFDAWVLV